jgi:hypothetical protein
LSLDVSILGTLGTLSIMFLFYILARLSERLGSVEKMAPLYRYYYVALFFLALGGATHFLVARVYLTPATFPDWLLSPWFVLLTHYLPLALGVTIGIVITWRYWSWLFTQLTK